MNIQNIKKAPTLWAHYSMLKATLGQKRKNDNYKLKKSLVFTRGNYKILYWGTRHMLHCN